MSQICKQTKVKYLNETQTQTILNNLLSSNLDSSVLSDVGDIDGEFLLSLTDKDLEEELKIDNAETRSNFFHQLEEYKRNGVPIIGDQIATEEHQLKACFQNHHQEMLIHLLSTSEDIVTAKVNLKKTKIMPCEVIKLADAKPCGKNVKQILFLGETGSGKSSLINSIVNVMFEVQQDREFGFKVANNEIQTGDSSTNSIQGYKLETMHSSYSYIFWDTPGVFHTKGFECDKKLEQDLSEFLSKIQRIDAIVIVEKSSEVLSKKTTEKLSQFKQYLFSQMLSSFGKDAIPHTYLFLTFPSYWDEKVPDLSQYLFPFNFSQIYIINNSVMFEKNSADKEISRKIWEKNVFNLRHFIDSIHTKGPMELGITTSSILKYKIELEKNCTELVKLIRELQTNQHKFEQLEKTKKQKESELKMNENHFYEVKEVEKVPTATKLNTVYCTICIHTCHADCLEMRKSKPEMKRCEAFDKNGNCLFCPKKCSVKHHNDHPYIMEEKEVKKQKVDQKMKQKYDDAESNLKQVESQIQRCDKEYQQIKNEGVKWIGEVKSSLNNVMVHAPHFSMNSTFNYLKLVKQQKQSLQNYFSAKAMEEFSYQYVVKIVHENQSQTVKPGQEKTNMNTLLETLKEKLTDVDKELGGEMI